MAEIAFSAKDRDPVIGRPDHLGAEVRHPPISVACELLGVSCSGLYG
jgi:hypothetical protein